MKHIMAITMITALLIAVGVGCGKGQNDTQPHQNAQSDVSFRDSAADKEMAIPSPSDVQMVVFQAADDWHTAPGGPILKGEPKSITAGDKIAAIVDAIKNPDGRAQTRFYRNTRLAIIAKNGGIVTFGITGATVFGCDITPHKSSKKLGKTLLEALPQAQVVRLELGSPIKDVSYNEPGKKKQLDLKTVEKPLVELLKLYKPLVLRGNRRCNASDIVDHAKNYPEFITVKLAKPDSFDAVVVVQDASWPPETYNTNTRLEQVRFDTITIFDEIDDQVRFVFNDSAGNQCLFTAHMKSLRVVKEAQGRNPAVYGSDLFNDVVSTPKP